MRVAQIATTAGKSCGIGNFALNLHRELVGVGVQVDTVTRLSQAAVTTHDVVVLQYGSALFEDGEAEAFCAGSQAPVVVFAHDAGATRLAGVSAGFLGMAPGMLDVGETPVLLFPHPAWTPPELADRADLKRRLGLPPGPVIGSSGFLMYHRQFPLLLDRLLPSAERHGWFVYLVTAEWFGGSPGLVEELEGRRSDHPANFRFDTAFHDTADLNSRLQACDLLWCWTKEPSTPSASGSVSDQYASGSRLVVTDKLQHSHVLALPNVVAAPPLLDPFVDQLVLEAHRGSFGRHDPSPVAWAGVAGRISQFLHGLLRG